MSSWESEDKLVSKEILEKESFTKKPTERAVCRIKIANVSLTRITIADLKKELHSDILDGSPEKILTLGNACTKLDREIERAIKTMFIKEKSLITIRLPSVAEIGNEDVLVKFEMTLDSFETFKPVWNWNPNEKYEIALEYKETGVSLFKSARYKHAFFMFSKACKILITLEPLSALELAENLLKNIGDLRIVLYNNMAECHLNRKNYEHAISLCCKVLERDENNVKALYRRGVAYGNLKNFEKALEDFKKVLIIEPKNSLAKEKFILYNEQYQLENKRYEKIVKRMFGTEK
ncbi:peptidyl-prolyl cis-trans isomerase FKBP4 [Belonocnema kinseyi]|uniref:peptidyl-prolyl cis-trans isomerase FKBP4 n=1 Tax=Belonocnema kinseyi TaxID=2817044 RepID=UPI00143D4B64|nr:peptidyl-prolyl cis-trans isomerase FKBP4 [Belonocnema kinseyi]